MNGTQYAAAAERQCGGLAEAIEHTRESIATVTIPHVQKVLNIGLRRLIGKQRQRRAAQSRYGFGSPPKCHHPPRRLYSWFAKDENAQEILCVACCQCGAVLKGGAK